ncbi:ParA family protein [bacterium SCSIO 12696]|uniref:ParA family protein n=1 Tax=Porticoccus sp. W117 TaxID=3054777 RepID=UPI00220B1E92|nr:AAA family ATPase [Porticoccus sp. W117]MDM3870784.1 AAA family ATPase [Porticoccus sp. W117]UTW44627.1 ParA family protein [bacterium SCSIO 12696]
MSRTLAIVNQKGGVGKTTTSVNLSASLASFGRRVLMVDMDAQGNATMGSGIDKNALEETVLDVLTGEADINRVICRCESGNFDVLPANSDLTAAEVELLNVANKESRLFYALSRVRDRYDYIIVDCPPALSMLTINALTASHGVIIPMQCEYYALEGLSALMETIQQINKVINPHLKIEGILRTMYDPRNSLTNEVTTQLRKHFGDKVYRVYIPRNVRLAEAPSYGEPAIVYDKHSKGSLAYIGLAGEIINRHRAEARQAMSA